MNRDEVMNLLRSFESRHSGISFSWKGVDFWPLIRPFLGMALHKTLPFDGLVAPPTSLWARRAGVVQRMLFRLRNYYRWVRELENQQGHALLVSYASRRRRSHGRYFHRMATPLEAFLRERDIPLNVWDFDVAPYRDPKAIPTQGIVQWRWLLSPERRPESPPPWFPALRDFLAELPVSTPPALLEWTFWQGLLGSILFRAGQYEVWLGRMKPRIVFIDCWYTSEALPVILATRRLGLPTVDLQHGVQGESHFGYAAWPDLQNAQLIPDCFWFWGRRDAEIFKAPSNAFQRYARAVVGGSLELNFFRERGATSDAEKVSSPDGVSILVTEQKGIDISNVLTPVIKSTVGRHRWIIRPHPGQQRSVLETALGSLASQVTLIPPRRETVYESLARADVHVTGFSSVALEALALGIRTVLVHPAAREIYGSYIDQGLMALALDAVDFEKDLEKGKPVSVEHYEAATAETFASVETTRTALTGLLDGD